MPKRVWVVVCILTSILTILLFHQEKTVSLNWLNALEPDDIAQAEVIRLLSPINSRYHNVPSSERAALASYLCEYDWSKALPISAEGAANKTISLHLTLSDGKRHVISRISDSIIYIDSSYYRVDPSWLSRFHFETDSPIPSDFQW